MYDLAGLRDELADLAVQIASVFDVSLDYSPSSVERVETILGEIHLEFRRTGQDDGMNGVALEFAAYIGKVIERNFEPGAWEENHAEFGEGTYSYKWPDREIFPYAWCQKRVFDGEADNVWSKFQALDIREAG